MILVIVNEHGPYGSYTKRQSTFIWIGGDKYFISGLVIQTLLNSILIYLSSIPSIQRSERNQDLSLKFLNITLYVFWLEWRISLQKQKHIKLDDVKTSQKLQLYLNEILFWEWGIWFQVAKHNRLEKSNEYYCWSHPSWRVVSAHFTF